jgi:hypothetical protein
LDQSPIDGLAGFLLVAVYPSPKQSKAIMIKPRAFRVLSILFLLTALSAQAAEPQQPSKQETSNEELVKQTQNPIADLISVPFQNNYNFAAGPKHNHMIYLLNIEPVIPIHITENWNLISRIVMPVINLPSLAPGIGSAIGLRDSNPTFFLSPAKSGELIWGVGPTFTLPTASDERGLS